MSHGSTGRKFNRDAEFRETNTDSLHDTFTDCIVGSRSEPRAHAELVPNHETILRDIS
jgi:hypothetical protein